MEILLGGIAGFLLAMLLYERQRLMGWLKAAGSWFQSQWQKISKKG